jgi:hypothetical protein
MMSTTAEFMKALLEEGPRGLSRFESSIEPQWIEEALAATGKASVRRRKFPADQVVWLVLGMAMFADRSIIDIVEHLDLVLPGSKGLARSSVPAARYRLGAAPIEWLFEKVATAWAETPGLGGYRGVSVWGVDGTHLRVQDSDENFAHFGKPGGRGGPGDAGYPQLRLACLLNLSNRLLRAARFGPWARSEQDLATELWPSLPDNSLVILDRGFVNYVTFASLVESGSNRNVLVRLRDNMKPVPIQDLADGSVLVDLHPTPEVLRQRPDLRPSIRGRIVAYQHPGGKPSRLFVTLVDHDRFPAKELVSLYHERWEIELAYDELKTHMLERKECLRSLQPAGVEQELWGLLLVYTLVRREMLLAAQAHKLPPKRISFRSSLLWIRNFWITALLTSPANIPRHLGELRSTLDVLIIGDRRPERRYPRHVKIKMSNFPRNRRVRSQPAAPVQGDF